MPVSSYILDDELIAAGASGDPDLRALLHGRTRGACVDAFDLLEWRGRDIREQPLVQRRAQLEAVLKRGASRLIRFSESFPDANVLLAERARRGPRGHRVEAEGCALPLGNALRLDKIKTREWKGANRYRAKLFEKPRR